MKSNKYLSVVSLAVLGLCCTRSAFAQLKATAFPGTFHDASFSQRVQTKAEGYEPYKNMKAYVIPEFKKTDQKFKDEMCERDREECCRRWPDYKNDTFSCLPQIIYEMYGGSKAKCKGTAPESYYTPKGATITCVPERKRSKFLGWCKDAGLTDCDMMQTIAPGEKDDKFFWASWDCEKSPYTWSYIKTQTSCDCPDENMDNNCKCSGRGMDPDSTAEGKCECLSVNASVQDGECVCTNDPSYDPTTDCTEPEPEPEPEECTDESHMDDDCNCLPLGKASPDSNGICKCDDDPNLDIDNDCEPRATPPAGKEYYIKQCRQKPGSGVCKTNNKESISDCFKQCKSKYNRHNKQFFLNNKIKRLVSSDAADFCSGSNEKGPHLFEFRDPATKSIKYYDETTAKAIFAAIRNGSTPGEVAPPFGACETTTNNWVLTLFKYDSATATSTKIDEIKIGE